MAFCMFTRPGVDPSTWDSDYPMGILRLNPVDSILNILRYGANMCKPLFLTEFLPEKMSSELSEIRLTRVDP